MIFDHPLLVEHIKQPLLDHYNEMRKKRNFDIFYKRCYRLTGVDFDSIDSNQFEDQFIKLYILKYFFLL